MSSPRLSGIAVLGILTFVLGGCASSDPAAVGVDSLTVSTLGTATESQQAFVDRMNELSEGSMTTSITENWKPTGGSDTDEVALTKAVLSGKVDMAWVTIRSLSAIGITGITALEAPLLVQTHDQQRAVALGVPGELITNALRKSGVSGLALIPGPEQYPVASGAPMLAAADWAGKTFQVSAENPSESNAVTALGGSPSTDGSGGVADVLGGSVQAAAVAPAQLVPDGATGTGPFMTANVALWPRMSIVLINTDLFDRLSSRQHGFLDGSVVRAQDLAMIAPDVATGVAEACKAGVRFGLATPDQLTALTAAVQPVYTALLDNPAEAKLLESIQDAVKRHAGNGSLSIAKACRWVAPK